MTRNEGIKCTSIRKISIFENKKIGKMGKNLNFSRWLIFFSFDFCSLGLYLPFSRKKSITIFRREKKLNIYAVQGCNHFILALMSPIQLCIMSKKSEFFTHNLFMQFLLQMYSSNKKSIIFFTLLTLSLFFCPTVFLSLYSSVLVFSYLPIAELLSTVCYCLFLYLNSMVFIY